MNKIVLSMCFLGLNVSAFGAAQAPNPQSPNVAVPVIAELKPEDRFPVLKAEVLRVIASVREAIIKNSAEIASSKELIGRKEAELSKFSMVSLGEEGKRKDGLKKEVDDLKKKVTQLGTVNQKLEKRVRDAEHIMSFAHAPVTNSNPQDPKVTDGHILSSYGCALVKATTGRRCDIPRVNAAAGNIFQRMGWQQPVAPVSAIPIK